MKTMNNLAATMLMSILAAATFTACSNNYMDDETEQPTTANSQTTTFGIQRTVLVYMAGRNDLSYYATADLEEMKKGSKQLSKDQALLVFMRRCQNGEEPWLARIENGVVTNKVTISNMGIKKDELYASDPEVMEKVMRYAYTKYPSVNDDYGLVLWGHGSGWLIENEVETKSFSRAYGVDTGNYIRSTNAKWINMPTLNDVLSRMPHLKFIFADCCNFMCLETLYELRHTADYIIGSPAEIPAEGARYDLLVPTLFESTTYYHAIIESYYQATNGNLPLTAVKTSEMENVAQATKAVFQSMSQRHSGFPDMTGMIHYNYLGKNEESFHKPYNIFYDAGNFILSYATPSEYQQWKQALDKAIIEKHIAKSWATVKDWEKFYTDFEVTEEKFHGVSMYVPQNPNDKFGEKNAQFNKDITNMQWFNAVNK